MKKLLALAVTLTPALLPASAAAELYVTVVQGLGGVPEYDEKFTAQRGSITEASRSLTGGERITALHGEQATRENLLAHFREQADAMTGDDRALIYLVGHGSYDGEQYKFNIPGPDITGTDLREVLDSLPGDNHFLLNTSSTSGAILETFYPESSDREDGNTETSGGEDSPILVTATRNGNERNATEFGAFFAEALTSEEADLNKNNSISVQEAFDYADRKVTDFFESDGKLATEHPQLRGQGAGRLTLARINQPEAAGDNPEISTLQEELREIDARIENLQLNRDEYSDEEYNRRFRELILESASVTEEIEALSEENNGGNAN